MSDDDYDYEEEEDYELDDDEPGATGAVPPGFAGAPLPPGVGRGGPGGVAPAANSGATGAAVGGNVCSPQTQDKVLVVRSYVDRYYKRVAHEGTEFRREHQRARRRKDSLRDYTLLKVIGRGAFGEVRLCRRVDDPSQTVWAIKILSKESMVRRRQVQHVRAERDLMVEARSRHRHPNPWVVELHSTFQDELNLYFVMEFCPGGDMMTWLMKYDIFEDAVARFYIAELVLAVQSLHEMSFAHRDLKPDNILIDRAGHIKLTDFGLSKQQAGAFPVPVPVSVSRGMPAAGAPAQPGSAGPAPGSTGGGAPGSTALGAPDASSGRPLPTPGAPASSLIIADETAGVAERREQWHRVRQREMFFSTVGSPGYIAPEVLLKRGYGLECDWWGVGIILYEMLVGYPPFYGEDNAQTSQKIVRWREFLEFPTGAAALPPLTVDFIRALLCDPVDRLGFAQIVAHPYFAGVDWWALRSQKAPFELQLQGPTDTQYFDELPETGHAATHPVLPAWAVLGDAAAAAAHVQRGGASAGAPHSAGGGVGPGAGAGVAESAGSKENRYLFYGFTSRFESSAQSTRTAAKRAARPGIPQFGDDE